MYVLLAISLFFALLLAFNIAASAAASILWRVVSPFLENCLAKTRAQFVFILRIFPFVGAFVLVHAFLLPAYLLFEPHLSEEIVSVKLALLAAASGIGIALAAFRLFGTWWRTRRLVAGWVARGAQISIENVDIPVYRIRHPFPIVAVVGTFRPQLFIASQIFTTLDEKEFRAVITHEYGHLFASDNFKRTVLRVCRDLLVFPFNHSLDRVWAENAESAADEYAAQIGGASTAVDLAAALIKIARIAPRGTKPAMPAGAFLIEAETADVAWRVRHLLQLPETKIIPAKIRKRRLNYLSLLYLGVTAIVLIFATNHNFLRKVHTILEHIVAALQ